MNSGVERTAARAVPWTEDQPHAFCSRIEGLRRQLADVEDELLCAELSQDLCQARFATAKVKALRARLDACDRS